MSLNDKFVGEILSALSDALLHGNSKKIKTMHSAIFNNAKPINRIKNSPANKENSQSSSIPAVKIEELRREIEGFETRDALNNFLKVEFDSKSKLTVVSRSLRIPTNKSDSYDAMLDKIIDATVGYKLRSRAIRGPQLTFDETTSDKKS